MSWRYTYANRLEQQNDKISGRHLQRILQYTMTPCRPLPTFKRTDCIVHNTDCDEVYPNLYVGDAASAKNKAFLRQIGVTHVLNTAEGSRFGQVDTGHAYYRDVPQIRYMGFPLTDHPSTDISRYFYIAAKFIDNAISSGGKVLVHCQMGISRSSTCAIVYLMIHRKMTAADAIRTIRLRRDIFPNAGFLQQLADLDNELRRERAPEIPRTTELAPMDYGRKPKLDRVGRIKSKCYTALMKDLFFNR
ncbi:dual specificity protein phosphatase 13 isoform X2 [Sitodiplosis mosellana]|uniref:dual specificity protein phosphatase 13 isoform X2 n=1 Tax=Sitodiplosis mosellana TaxID=263140 RepID=UPI002444DD1E|nr:dual specificity protein phosphatase 13 isoform X2 [Sitodiplosis mosellana]XP_055306437.1 dual specificity protein phosphatase 13 isoform X2 [Sitodiplosis mosellana]XP_055306438.1 dual specificity protein phosphatase 13 isoform X2 [Sitodiplosis mosellana]